MLRFQVLGRLTVTNDLGDCTPSAPMARRVLAQLLLCSNNIVMLDAIIDELWGDKPPKSAVPTAQTYIYQLRRQFEPWVPEGTVEHVLATCGTGYMLRVDPEQLDLGAFLRLAKQGQTALAAGDPAAAARILRQALHLWSGPALADVTAGPSIQAHVVHLTEQRAHTVELRIQADAMLGRHRELVGELKAMLLADPLNEWYHAQLIKALASSGRRKESLVAYQHLRRILSAELGLEPSGMLRELHQEVLAGRDSWSDWGVSGRPLAEQLTR
ncbi:AfsR/SARP family transcriptional regulator [Streptomyces sp. NBC_00536]|uniref:AfsR/SARP family transcriptional regulator n=1 Tax=Streptomyces sp. NBC_00536 TaxID=2975769 RepID=UPI002E7FB904|nr:AfsR/SARP family transcriptional regulator [Streptomyces sp. NBC_00536]WUC77691.1 AfsR/SARP family transcriptional regulator [Streptomyces sp. NBC_00536]